MFWTNALIDVLLFLFVVNCLLMCLVVLMQRSKQEGLGAAFGGGFTDSVWGAQTSQVLVKTTVWLAAFFFILSISLARLYAHREAVSLEKSPVQEQLLHPITTAPAAVPAFPTNAAGSTVVPTAAPMTPSPAVTATNAAPVSK